MELLKEVKFLVIHHTQGTKYSINSLRDFHVNKNHWEEIGYHYCIGNGINTEDGKIYRTRPEKFMGAHTIQLNRVSLGIALMGNFNKTMPTEKQFYSIMRILKKLMEKYKIPTKNIIGHNEIKGVTKTCPGKNFDMKKLRKILELSKNFI